MYLILEIIFILFIIGTMTLLIKDWKYAKINKEDNVKINPKDKKLTIVIILFTQLVFYLIGRFLKTDKFNMITFYKDGINISFEAIFLVFFISKIVAYTIEPFKNKDKNKEQ